MYVKDYQYSERGSRLRRDPQLLQHKFYKLLHKKNTSQPEWPSCDEHQY